MSYTADTIELDDVPNMRARIEQDEYPDAPYFEAGVPTYRVDRHRDFVGAYGSSLTHVYGETSSVVEEAWDRIVDCYGKRGDSLDDAVEFLDRYLSIFHGGSADVLDGGDWQSPAYIVAVTQEQLRNWTSGETSKQIIAAELRSSEWKSYIEGDVYGIVIEEKAIEVTHVRTLGGEPIRTLETETWETIESVWGFYGDAWGSDSCIQGEAREMLKMHAQDEEA